MALKRIIEDCRHLLVDENNRNTQLLQDYFAVRSTMSYGKERRAMLLSVIERGFEFPVNGKHLIQTKRDPDIKKLIKQGKIQMVNKKTGMKTKRTHLVLKK